MPPLPTGNYMPPPCIPQIRYQKAEADLRAADSALAQGRLADASRQALEGIEVLGPDYLGDGRQKNLPFDDTGQGLQVTYILEAQGFRKKAVNSRASLLKDRLDMAKEFALCGRKR